MAVRSPRLIPKNIEDFIQNGWDKQILFRIRTFSLKDILNNEEELVQDIVLALLETDYLTRYNPERPFTTYLYGFVDNFLKKRYNKENTVNGKKIVNYAGIEMTPPEGDPEFNGSKVYLDLLFADSSEDADFDMKLLLEEIREELKKYKANSSAIFNGIELQRDALTVFNLIMEDFSVIDIARMLDTSRQYIYHLIKKIRDLPILQELRYQNNHTPK